MKEFQDRSDTAAQARRHAMTDPRSEGRFRRLGVLLSARSRPGASAGFCQEPGQSRGRRKGTSIRPEGSQTAARARSAFSSATAVTLVFATNPRACA